MIFSIKMPIIKALTSIIDEPLIGWKYNWKCPKLAKDGHNAWGKILADLIALHAKNRKGKLTTSIMS